MQSDKQAEINKALIEAVKSQHLEGVKVALAKGADINARDRYTMNNPKSAVGLAASNGNLEIVEFLCDQGADIDASVPKEDRAFNVDVGNTAIEHAARNGHLDVVKTLYKRMKRYNDRGIMRDDNRLQVLLAVSKTNVLEYLFEQGVFFNIQDSKTGGSIVHNYVEYVEDVSEFKTHIQWLVDHNVYLGVRNYNGETALHMALTFSDDNSMEKVKILCDAKVNVNAKDIRGETPLHYAIDNDDLSMQDRYEIICYLCQHGADLNVRDNEGQTFLMMLADKCKNDLGTFVNEEQRVILEKLFDHLLITYPHCLLTNSDELIPDIKYIQSRVEPNSKLFNSLAIRLCLTDIYLWLTRGDFKYFMDIEVPMHLSVSMWYNSEMLFSDLKSINKGQHTIVKTESMRQLLLTAIYKIRDKLNQKNILRFLIECSDYLQSTETLVLVQGIDLSHFCHHHMLGNELVELATKLFELANDWDKESGEQVKNEVTTMRCYAMAFFALSNENLDECTIYLLQLLEQLVPMGSLLPAFSGRVLQALDQEKKGELIECLIRNTRCESIRGQLMKSLAMTQEQTSLPDLAHPQTMLFKRPRAEPDDHSDFDSGRNVEVQPKSKSI